MKLTQKLIGAVLLLGLASFIYANKAQGHYVSRMVEKLPAFDTINVQGDIDVDFMQHPTATVHASGPQKALETVTVRAKNNVLEISYLPQRMTKNSGKVRVMITGPDLHEVTVNNAGDVHVRGKLQTQRLAVALSQNGEFSADGITAQQLMLSAAGKSEIDINRLDAHDVHAVANDTADIELAGLALQAQFENNGTGEIDASDLRVQTAQATVNGKGEISVFAYENLTASVLGKGKIKYKGSPVSLTQTGNRKRIIHHNDD